MPWEVARGIGEAVTDQEMACLLFAQELSGISKSRLPRPCPGRFLRRGEGGGNVRGAAVGRPPTGRPASPGAATGWAIPPDPQQPKTGGILVR